MASLIQIRPRGGVASNIVLGRLGPVKLLVLQGTPFCNINCRYCYLPDRNNKSRMSLATVDAVIDRLLEDKLLKGPLLVNWHAGEPLVLPPEFYLERIARFERLRFEGIDVEHSLQTNAMLVTAEHCKLFKTHDIKVGVSVDGPAFIHDQQRMTRSGQPTHDRVQHGMLLLRAHEVPFNAICVLSDLSVRHPHEMFEYFRSCGARAVAFNIEEIEGANKTSSILEEGFAVRLRSFFSTFWDLVEADGGRLRVREFDDAESRILDTHPRRNSQADPFVNVSVAWNGDWSTFCPELLGTSFPGYPDFTLGNVHTGGFIAALKEPAFMRLYADITRGVEACKESCQYFEVCGGGNPSNKIAENGSFSSTETVNCRNRIMNVCDFMIEKIEDRIRAKRASCA